MPLVDVAVLAFVRGLAEALGLSASGAEAAMRVLLEPARAARAVEAALAFGAALALALAVRRRIGAMLVEAVRGFAHPALFSRAPGGRDAMLLAI
ncbi:MAG TPA: UDP kinase, partial [Minicystis sp.]|nr:UDP kinase [Minicystis sp.]